MRGALVVGLGSVVVDQQMFVERFPIENEKEHALQTRQQIGGPVPTSLVLLARFGTDCYLIAPWGDDLHGQEIEADLNKEGVDFSSSCAGGDRRTGTAHVWISNGSGDRTIVAHQCDWNDLALSSEDLARLRGCQFLHLDGTGGELAVEAARVVRESGGRVFIDAGSPKAATAKLIGLADVISFPERFAKQFFETDDVVAAGEKLLELGAKAAICTQGERGSLVFETHQTVRVSAIEVAAIDSTGAGDVFCGGVLAGLLEGLELEQASKLGAAAAAHKCRHIGNRDGLPRLADVREILES
ncbi:MAG: PfkB family carbohydrate kinase [Pirellulaceae bacterium]|nr:PfkB family carbohydrate kinase [Pirellulaceae bacterium]